MSTFAENLSRLMKERKITGKYLAEKTGIPRSTISEWTAGRIPKLSEDIIKLAHFFGVSIEALITGQEPEIDFIKDFIKKDNGFVQIHKGIYRVVVEKRLER